MPRFLVVYRGASVPSSELPEREHDAVMARWGEWMDRNGAVVEDPGFPFGTSAAVDGVGADREATNLAGYSILRGESVEEIREVCRDHPFLHGNGAEHTVEIFELTPI